jgi:hypothetical protein
MGLLDGFRKKEKVEQAVIVRLDGTSQSDPIYEEHDLGTLEEHIHADLEGKGVGELDSNEIGPEGATLYLYGPDAQKLDATVESVLRANPLCNAARVTIRRGKPGAPQTEF